MDKAITYSQGAREFNTMFAGMNEAHAEEGTGF